MTFDCKPWAVVVPVLGLAGLWGCRAEHERPPAQPGFALKQTLTGHEHYVNSVAFSPDGQHLAWGSGDFTIKLWEPTQ